MHEGMIVSLERGLSSYRFLSLPELNQYASSTVQNISDAYQMVAASTQDLASTAQQSEAVMVRLESIITNQFQPTAMMLDQVVQGLSSAVGTHNQLVTVVQNAQNGLAATQQQMGAYVQQMQSSFSAELSALRSGVDDMVRNAGSGSQQIVQSFGDSLDRTIQSLSNSLAQTVNDLARSSSDAANAINSAASSMADTSDVLKSTMASVELGVQRMNADLDSIHRKNLGLLT
jgi:ABC-type transporter Mla subunit MlaD